MKNEKQFLVLLADALGNVEEIIIDRLRILESAATGFKFRQRGDNHMITGAAPGASCRIIETPVPAGGQLQPGSALTWSTPDSLVSLAPSSDGASVVCSIDPTNKNTNFPLHLDGTASDGTAIFGDVAVPIQQPQAIPATGFSFDQGTV